MSGLVRLCGPHWVFVVPEELVLVTQQEQDKGLLARISPAGDRAAMAVASYGYPHESRQEVLDGLALGLCDLWCHVWNDETLMDPVQRRAEVQRTLCPTVATIDELEEAVALLDAVHTIEAVPGCSPDEPHPIGRMILPVPFDKEPLAEQLQDAMPLGGIFRDERPDAPCVQLNRWPRDRGYVESYHDTGVHRTWWTTSATDRRFNLAGTTTDCDISVVIEDAVRALEVTWCTNRPDDLERWSDDEHP